MDDLYLQTDSDFRTNYANVLVAFYYQPPKRSLNCPLAFNSEVEQEWMTFTYKMTVMSEAITKWGYLRRTFHDILFT